HDVARTEHLTFVCTEEREDAGPNNNWMAPDDARKKLTPLYRGAMKGRTMYVVPFLMGPPGSRFSKVGVEITDSKYVVLNMRIMTRVGQVAIDHLGNSDDFTRCLHSLGDLSPERRFICHFPEANTVWSVGSGYGGNALLGKKCLALRLASWLGKKEGWLAEHMLILALRSPEGKTHYVTGAFRPDGTPWWEGHDDPPPENALDWQGRPWTPKSAEKAAHANSRFTTHASQCPSISPEWEKPEGVPISAMLFGARRQRTVPLVFQSRTWQHGVFLAATLS